MKLYKLTDKLGRTRRTTKWGKGVTHKAEKGRGDLCTNKYIHAYTDPVLALMMNPIHAGIENPQLWTAEGRISKTDGLKVGCKTLKTITRIKQPTVTINHRFKFALLAVMEICKKRSRFGEWAKGRLANPMKGTPGEQKMVDKYYNKSGSGKTKKANDRIKAKYNIMGAAKELMRGRLTAATCAALAEEIGLIDDSIDFAALARKAMKK